MDIRELDTVKLKDGREGAVVGVWTNGKAFEVEFLDDEGYTISVDTIERDEIAAVTWRRKEEAA